MLNPDKQKAIEFLKELTKFSTFVFGDEDREYLAVAVSSIHREAQLEEALMEILGSHGNIDTGSCEICSIAQQALTQEKK